jgi:exonuclease VII large subunit
VKFTKEEAREKITAMFSKKVEKIADWERTIKEHVETLCELVGEDSEIELDAFAEKAVKMLETQKGHINKANSTLAENFNKQIEELKKQIEEPAKKKKKDEVGNDDGKKDETIAKLEERLKKLEDEKQAEETKKTIGQKREQLAAEIKKKGVKNDKWVKSMLDKAKIDENTDIEAEAESYLEMYNEFFSEMPEDDDLTPRGAGSASHLEKIKETIKAAGEALKAEQGE